MIIIRLFICVYGKSFNIISGCWRQGGWRDWSSRLQVMCQGDGVGKNWRKLVGQQLFGEPLKANEWLNGPSRSWREPMRLQQIMIGLCYVFY